MNPRWLKSSSVPVREIVRSRCVGDSIDISSVDKTPSVWSSMVERSSSKNTSRASLDESAQQALSSKVLYSNLLGQAKWTIQMTVATRDAQKCAKLESLLRDFAAKELGLANDAENVRSKGRKQSKRIKGAKEESRPSKKKK